MNTTRPTLKTIGLDATAIESGLAAILETKVPPVLPPRFLPTVVGRVRDALLDLLDQPLPEILAGAWAHYAPLLPYGDREQVPPGQPVRVSLGAHAVESSWRPRVEIVANGRKLLELPCVLSVRIRCRSVDLLVRDGRVYEASLRRCRGALRLRVAGILLGDRRNVKLLSDPFTLEFAEGIPIVPRTGTPSH